MKKIEKICPICSKKFEVPLCHANRYLTCGRICGGIIRRKKIVHKNCLYCDKDFIPTKGPSSKQKYCSINCWHNASKTGAEKKCLECGKSFYAIPYKFKKKQFCSKACQLNKWNRDSIAAQMPNSYNRNAWKTYEKKCYDCQTTDERVLVIHHIDSNRKNGKVDNLIPVCHNCHCIRHIEMSGNHRISSYRGRN